MPPKEGEGECSPDRLVLSCWVDSSCQCDQTYPACLRCIKRKTGCPGVKDIRTQVFRDETRKTSAKIESRKRHRQEPLAILESEPVSSQQANIIVADRVTDAQPTDTESNTELPTIASFGNEIHDESFTRHLDDSPEDVLVTFFFDQIICPNVRWYSYLPSLYPYRNAIGASYLSSSVQAASLFALANQHDGSRQIGQLCQ